MTEFGAARNMGGDSGQMPLDPTTGTPLPHGVHVPEGMMLVPRKKPRHRIIKDCLRGCAVVGVVLVVGFVAGLIIETRFPNTGLAQRVEACSSVARDAGQLASVSKENAAVEAQIPTLTAQALADQESGNTAGLTQIQAQLSSLTQQVQQYAPLIAADETQLTQDEGSCAGNL